MSRISSQLLTDTLSIVQLARETAIQNGKQAQADRLNSVAVPLKGMVNSAQDVKSKPAASTAPTGMLAQSDFQTLLNASKTERTAASPSSTAATSQSQSVNSALERNRMVLAMGQGGMSDLDIARQLGMAREEVRLVLNVQQSAGIKEVK